MTTYAYQIQAFQVDFQRKATITTIGNYLLQTAGQDADRRGFGLNYMLPNNRAWVLARFSIRMNEYPGPQEMIQIETWIHDIGALLTTRKFNILNKKGYHIGEASSSWVAMDLKSRRPLRLSSFLRPDYIIDRPDHTLDPPPKLIPHPTYQHTQQFKVAYSDLDLNRHVYSIRYIQWILDTIPLDYFSNRGIHRLDINYLSEALYADEITLLSEHSSTDQSHFLIKNKKRGNIAVGKIAWLDLIEKNHSQK